MREYIGQTQAAQGAQQIGAGYLGGQITGAGLAKDREPNALESLNRDLEHILERVGKINTRISVTADRVFGQQPQSINKAESAPQPSAMLPLVHDQLNRLRGYLAYTEDELQRLEQL